MKKNTNTRIKETIGLIGAGNMGTAILEGLFRKGLASPSQVWVTDKAVAKAKAFCKRWKTKFAADHRDLIRRSEIILLAFKPQDLASLAGAAGELTGRHILMTILAGTPIARIARTTGGGAKVVRAMPNLGARIGESVTAVTGSDRHAVRLAERIFSGCGSTVRLPEDTFDAVTAVSGSGPAYFFLLMELLMKEAVERGIGEKQARVLAVQTAVAAAMLAKASDEKPEDLRLRVTSKGGTTEAALKAFDRADFAGIFHHGIDAAVLRGKELSEGSF